MVEKKSVQVDFATLRKQQKAFEAQMNKKKRELSRLKQKKQQAQKQLDYLQKKQDQISSQTVDVQASAADFDSKMDDINESLSSSDKTRESLDRQMAAVKKIRNQQVINWLLRTYPQLDEMSFEEQQKFFRRGIKSGQVQRLWQLIQQGESTIVLKKFVNNHIDPIEVENPVVDEEIENGMADEEGNMSMSSSFSDLDDDFDGEMIADDSDEMSPVSRADLSSHPADEFGPSATLADNASRSNFAGKSSTIQSESSSSSLRANLRANLRAGLSANKDTSLGSKSRQVDHAVNRNVNPGSNPARKKKRSGNNGDSGRYRKYRQAFASGAVKVAIGQTTGNQNTVKIGGDIEHNKYLKVHTISKERAAVADRKKETERERQIRLRQTKTARELAKESGTGKNLQRTGKTLIAGETIDGKNDAGWTIQDRQRVFINEDENNPIDTLGEAEAAVDLESPFGPREADDDADKYMRKNVEPEIKKKLAEKERARMAKEIALKDQAALENEAAGRKAAQDAEDAREEAAEKENERADNRNRSRAKQDTKKSPANVRAQRSYQGRVKAATSQAQEAQDASKRADDAAQKAKAKTKDDPGLEF